MYIKDFKGLSSSRRKFLHEIDFILASTRIFSITNKLWKNGYSDRRQVSNVSRESRSWGKKSFWIFLSKRKFQKRIFFMYSCLSLNFWTKNLHDWVSLGFFSFTIVESYFFKLWKYFLRSNIKKNLWGNFGVFQQYLLNSQRDKV